MQKETSGPSSEVSSAGDEDADSAESGLRDGHGGRGAAAEIDGAREESLRFKFAGEGGGDLGADGERAGEGAAVAV